MNIKSLKYFLGFLKKYTAQEIVLIILMFLSSAGTLVSPFILKIIIDDVFPSRDFGFLLYILGIYLLISVARLIITYISTYMFERVSNNIMKDIRLALFSHLIRLPLGFYDQSKTGDVIHRVNSEVNSIQTILTGSVVRVINSACTIIGLTTMLCILNYKLFLISLVVMPFIYINTRYFQPRIQANIRAGRTKDSEVLSYLMERFANIKILKSYMCYGYEEKKLSDHIDEQVRLNMRNVKLSSTTRTITLIMTILVPVVILCLGGRDVMLGLMTVGSLVAFIQYMNRLFSPFRDLMGLYFDMVRATVSMDRIYEIISLEPEETTAIDDAADHKDRGFTFRGQDIKFENVSFSYDGTPVLDNINLTLRSGLSYAVVGPSGCGKSTLTNLLCRFYTPGEGRVYAGNTDIQTVDMSLYRSKINLVTQDDHIFHDTIKNNLCYGDHNIQEDDMIKAAKNGGLYDHIMGMPEEFGAMVGDQGVTLSGGQRQRIAISRSFLRPSEIIILDEATSALDSDTEKHILDNIYNENKGKTILVVSHRISTIKDVDVIICINRGNVVETGDHDSLIRKKGVYWRLFKEQI